MTCSTCPHWVKLSGACCVNVGAVVAGITTRSDEWCYSHPEAKTVITFDNDPDSEYT